MGNPSALVDFMQHVLHKYKSKGHLYTLLQYVSINTANILGITLVQHVSTFDSHHQTELRTV